MNEKIRWGKEEEISEEISSLPLLVRILRRLKRARGCIFIALCPFRPCIREPLMFTETCSPNRSFVRSLIRAPVCTCISPCAVRFFGGGRPAKTEKRRRARKREKKDLRFIRGASGARRAAKESRVPLHNHLTHGTFRHANSISGRARRPANGRLTRAQLIPAA